MTSDTISCPYCNTLIAVPPATEDGQGLVCRRCGESFAYHGPTEEETAATTRSSPAGSSILPGPGAPGPATSRSLSFQRKSVVLGLLATILIGAGPALLLLREWWPRPRTNSDSNAQVAHVKPTELVGLGFLPDDTNIIVGLHVAEARQHPAGQQLLAWLQENNVRTQILNEWTGIKLEEMDHAVLGLILGDKMPRVMLVVRTLRAYDPDEVKAAVKARPWPERKVPPLYQISLKGAMDLPAFLRFVDERTLVVTLQSHDADRVPARPRNGIEHLSEKMRQNLQENIRPTAQAWIVGHIEDWDKVSEVLSPLPVLLGDAWNVLRGVRTWAADVLSQNDDLVVHGLLECRDEKAAKDVGHFLAPESKISLPSQFMGPQAQAVLSKIRQSVQATPQGTRVDLQSTIRIQTNKAPDRGEKP